MAARDLLLEIGTEEIPAKFMSPALENIKVQAKKLFQEARIGFEHIDTVGTPRRLVLLIKGLAENQEDLTVEAKGPAKKAAYDGEGKPTRALEGFARSQGVSLNDLAVRELKGVEYVYAIKSEKGKTIKDVLPQLLQQLIIGIPFPKPMRWAWGEMRFARPIRWIVALYGQDEIPLEIGGVKAGRTTTGHRFLASTPFNIQEPGEYAAKMEKAFVIVDQRRRKEMIWQQIQEAARQEGGHVQEDPALLEEIAHLVEYPTALVGFIDDKYTKLPDAVIITPMKEHQRYFPVMNAQGKLLPRFITVRNGTNEHIDNVRIGNERVLKARLADAAFFYEEDQKTPLEKLLPKLEKIVFQESLGTVAQRVERMVGLTGYIADNLRQGGKVAAAEGSLRSNALRAAKLAKADLVTHMVYEFPELQGLMGEEYARLEGELPQVAQAIREHYMPRFAGDDVPKTMEGTLVALAEKLDVIVGCFSVGIIPSGSQDPYGLRRQAQGICQILSRMDGTLSLQDAIAASYNLYQGMIKNPRNLDEVQKDLSEFFKGRMRHLLGESGVRYDVIDSVLAAGSDNIADVYRRAYSLDKFRADAAFQALTTAYTRAANLASKGSGAAVQKELLIEAVEKDLQQALSQAQQAVQGALHRDEGAPDYEASLRAIAELRPAIDAFFDGVMVMVEDNGLRQNRLALLGAVVALTNGVADLSKIVN